MRFDKYIPADALKLYIRYYAVSDSDLKNGYTVFPSPRMIIGFQYKGSLATIHNGRQTKLAGAGITGIAYSYQI